MKKLLYSLIVVFCLVFVFSVIEHKNIYAEENDTSSQIIDDLNLTEEEQEVLTELELQLENIKAIVITIISSMVGTGIITLIVKIAIDKLVNNLKKKTLELEQRNIISANTAQKSLELVDAFKTEAYEQINKLTQVVDKLIESQTNVDKNLQTLIEEYEIRDEKLRNLLEENLLESNE